MNPSLLVKSIGRWNRRLEHTTAHTRHGNRNDGRPFPLSLEFAFLPILGRTRPNGEITICGSWAQPA